MILTSLSRLPNRKLAKENLVIPIYIYNFFYDGLINIPGTPIKFITPKLKAMFLQFNAVFGIPQPGDFFIRFGNSGDFLPIGTDGSSPGLSRFFVNTSGFSNFSVLSIANSYQCHIQASDDEYFSRGLIH